MKKLITLTLLLASFSVFAGGSQNKNPVKSVEVGEDCVLVFADGIDVSQCNAAPSPDQSQQAYLCELVLLCPAK